MLSLFLFLVHFGSEKENLIAKKFNAKTNAKLLNCSAAPWKIVRRQLCSQLWPRFSVVKHETIFHFILSLLPKPMLRVPHDFYAAPAEPF
jgi:hypothetical protein